MTNVEPSPSRRFNIKPLSKGFGRIQVEILEAIGQDREVSASRLMWDLALSSLRVVNHPRIKRQEAHPLPKGEMLHSFYVSFRRSISLLKDNEAVNVLKRKLEDLNELVELYPFMTRDLQTKELRHRLLPHVRTYLMDRAPKYDQLKNELHLVEHARDDERASWRDEWLELEDQLCANIGTVSRADRDALVAILARGKELFLRLYSPFSSSSSSRYKYEDSLGALIRNLRESVLERDCAAVSFSQDLGEFYDRCFPKGTIKHVTLKSQLHNIWDGSSLGPPKLLPTFKDYLLDVEHCFISSLPGHLPGSGHRVLEDLLARNVFQSLEFLAIT